MALTTGQLLSGAGAVGTGWRQAEEAERQARQSQLIIEAQNRANQAAIERQAARAGLQVPNVPQFAGMTGGQQFTAPGAATPQAQAQAQPQQPAAQAFPVNMNVPQAQPLAPVGEEAKPMTQAERDRIALLKPITAAADVFQAPVAAGLNVGMAGFEGVLNIGGRLVNAVTGEEVLPTDFQGPRFGMTPFYDRYVREPEAKAAGVRPELLAAQQRAESGGDTTAVSPKGATGLMQVMPETAMSPGFGLPNVFDFAQQQGVEVGERTKEEAQRLLKIPEVGGSFGVLYANAMSQKYGGDEVLMLAAYNWGPGNVDNWIASGRDPRMLPAETRDYIEKTLRWAGTDQKALGTTPAKTADSVSQAVADTPTAAGVMYGPSSVAGGIQNPNVQSALMLRQMLAADYEIFNRNRMFDQADQALAQVAAIDLGLYKAQADLGIQELTVSGDASRAMSVYSQFTGTPTQVLRRSDGTYDLYSNGQLAQTAVPVNALAELIKTAVDAGYRQQKAELAKEMAIIGLEEGLKLKQEELKQIGSIQTAMINGQYDILAKQAERDGKLTVDTANGVSLYQLGGKLYQITPNAVTEVAGVQQTGPQAQAINLP